MTVEPILLTPGPLTTRIETRRAMLRDWGSRDPSFIAMTAELRDRLLAVVNGRNTHSAIPLQGSGTFIVEAAIGSLVRDQDKLLVLVNGAYGDRIVNIARRLGRQFEVIRWEENEIVDVDALERALTDDSTLTHVALVHCETTTGILNPLGALAEVVAAHGKALILDAMSSFGALPIDLAATPVTAVLASSNKCLEGTPGVGFAIVQHEAISASQSNSSSLSLDLHDQWRAFEANGQWRFTPPVQVVAALVEALRALDAEGGPERRLERYTDNLQVLVEGMERFGFRLFLHPAVQAPIIATFVPPAGTPFNFEHFYGYLAKQGFLIYPGKLTKADSFRIGCIGAITRQDILRLLQVIGQLYKVPGDLHLEDLNAEPR